MAYLILVRHGESQWNKEGKWTGLTDIPLTQKGFEEAREAAKAIKDIHIDIAYTTSLSRAKQTVDEIKSSLNALIPTYENSALNERDYGDLTGKNKWKIKEEFGDEQFLKWRRSWNHPIPGGETLKDVYQRVVSYYTSTILSQLKNGKNVLVVAHGNSLRALIKYLENISDEKIIDLEFGTGTVYIYDIDNDGKVINKETRIAKEKAA